jgi:hypothetical protein
LRVGIAARQAGRELIPHPVRVRATHMIAFQKNLVAATHADHLMTQIVKPCLISIGREDAEKRS